MIHSFFRVLKFAFQDFFRNIWLSLATLTVIVITLVLINTVIFLNVVKDASITALKDKIDIALNFKTSATNADVLSVKSFLEKDSRVSEVTIVTPAENLEEFKKSRPDIADKYLPSIETNPLGYALKIKANDVNDYLTILDSLNNNPEYSDMFYDQPIPQYQFFVTRVSDFVSRINPAALILIAIFLFIALSIAFNTVRMNIYTHREEIGIMKLVGATNWFVRTPFLIESVLYSFVGVGIVAIIMYFFLIFSQNFLQTSNYANFLAPALNISPTQLVQLFLLELTITALINLMSTAIAIRRYLKV